MSARSPISRLNARRTRRPSRSACRLGCMEAAAVTATAAAITFSIGYLVDRRAGPAPIRRATSRPRHVTMAVTAGASARDGKQTRNAGGEETFAGVFLFRQFASGGWYRRVDLNHRPLV